MDNHNYASWDTNNDNSNNLIEKQFAEANKSQTFSRDEINDKLSQRGNVPFLAQSNNLYEKSNDTEKFYGRLDQTSSSRKPENNKNNKDTNQIWNYQFTNFRDEFKYNEPIKTINSRNLNSK